LTTLGHFLSVFGRPLTKGNFPLPLGSGSCFHKKSLEVLHNLPPLLPRGRKAKTKQPSHREVTWTKDLGHD